MREKNQFSTNSGINNPDHVSDMYISENERLFGDNFATADYYRRKMENEKKKEKYKFLQNQLLEREKKRWERLDYEYLRKENQNMMNKERNLVGRKNNPGMAFNPLNLQYDNSVQGEILKRRDEESKYRAWLRSINIDKHSNTGYNIINGEERRILEERLDKDIVPDIIQKNLDQINEMKNKIVFNYNNFYTKCNPSSPDLRGSRYDNSNMGNSNNNRINKSNTPNVFNNNGGRYRSRVDIRDERNYYDNGVSRSNNIMPRNNNNVLNNNYNNFNNNNDFNYMNDINSFSPQPRSPPRQIINDGNYINNMNNMNNMNINNNNMNNNMNNNNDFYNNRENNINQNVGIIDNNIIENGLNYNLNNDNQVRMSPRQMNSGNNNIYPENNNTLNNNALNNNSLNNNTLNNNEFMNNNGNNNLNDPNYNQTNQINNNQNINVNNNQNNNPNNYNLNGNNNNNMGGNDYYKGNMNNPNQNLNQGNNGQNNFVGQVQSNYNVNPYNPFSRPDSN